MLPKDVWKRRELMAQFQSTELGKAFVDFDHCLSTAWREDVRLEYTDANPKSADNAWIREGLARDALLMLLLPLAGIKEVQDAKSLIPSK